MIMLSPSIVAVLLSSLESEVMEQSRLIIKRGSWFNGLAQLWDHFHPEAWKNKFRHRVSSCNRKG
jgi:hypothetical protein